MAIDTADRRSSVIGQAMISLMVPPIPDSGISKDDRRHNSALYRGIDTAIIPRFRWIPEQDSNSTYKCEQDTTSTYTCETDSSIQSAEMVDSDEG